MMGINPMEEVEIYEPVGCEHCNDTGFYGRTGIYEMMPVTSTLRNAIADGCLRMRFVKWQ